jgi:hypothetical protein
VAAAKTVERIASPAGSEPGTNGRFPVVLLVVPPLLALGLLLLAASYITPSRVPWPAVSQTLYVHRPDLVVFGVGMIMLSLLLLAIAALL